MSVVPSKEETSNRNKASIIWIFAWNSNTILSLKLTFFSSNQLSGQHFFHQSQHLSTSFSKTEFDISLHAFWRISQMCFWEVGQTLSAIEFIP